MKISTPTILSTSTKKVKNMFASIGKRIDRFPLSSFFGLIAIVLVLIVVGNYFRKPVTDAQVEQPEAKTVDLYSIGSAPTMQMQAKVEKSSVAKVMAQSAGIVQSVRVKPGDSVSKGQTLVNLSTTPSGANISSLSRQLAQRSLQSVEENFPLQLEMIAKRREVAEKQDTLADDLRVIGEQSLGDTRALVSLNEEMLKNIDQQIKELEAAPGSATSSALSQVRQAKAGILGGLVSLRSGLKNAEYQAAADQEPARLSDLGREIAIKQLEMEEKSLHLNKDISALNLKIAQVSESLMYPASPCKGIVERVFAQQNQAINPGQPVASITCDQGASTAVVAVSRFLAQQVSRLEPSMISLGNEQLAVLPLYVSTEPTEGILYSVTYALPERYQHFVGDGGYVSVAVPIGNAKTSAVVPFIPLDAVYQTERSSYIYIAVPTENNEYKAETRQVKLGKVFGSQVEVIEGLDANDQVILDRNVIHGDLVTGREMQGAVKELGMSN